MQQLVCHHLHSKLSPQTYILCRDKNQKLIITESKIYLCGTLEKKLWNSEDTVLRGNLSPILCVCDEGGGACIICAVCEDVLAFCDNVGVCWSELCGSEGERGGDEVGVEVGVTKRSEFARECVRGVRSCSCSGAKLSLSVLLFSSCVCGNCISRTLCPKSVLSVDCKGREKC